MTKEDYETLLAMASNAAVIGVGLSIWQIIMCFVLGKAISSMWILINTVQFIVYMSLWQINYERVLRIFFRELKRIVLAEFFDDLAIGKKLKEAIGISKDDDEEASLGIEQEVGECRLGPKDPGQNMGATFLIMTLIFVILVLVALAILLLTRKKIDSLSQKSKERF